MTRPTMNAREVIIQELYRLGSFLPEDEADSILYSLRVAGFVILSRSEVEALRDKVQEDPS